MTSDFFAPTADGALSLAHIAEIMSSMGFGLKTEKSAISNNNVRAGMAAFFPQPSNQMSMVISLPRDKARRLANMIYRAIKEGSISHATIESLIGRLSLALTAIFGRFDRAMLKPLYTMVFRKRYSPTSVCAAGSQPTVVGGRIA